MSQIDIEIARLLQYEKPYVWRGGAVELLQSHHREVIIEGPSETGKTYAACYKSHMACREYAGAQGALVRKIAADIPGTVLLTMKHIIGNFPVSYYGGDFAPERIIYPNGSVIWIGGMDKPGKVLSSDRDFFQVCQAEELNVADWETMTTRVTGRNATMPYTQIFGDCNPGGHLHWIQERAKAGHLRLIHSRHLDNPALYDEDGGITAHGISTMDTLGRLTGVRRQRLLLGQWVTAEGVVYDGFNREIHVKVRNPKEFRYWLIGIDPGYTNPAAMGLIGVDNDVRLHQEIEFYRTGILNQKIIEVAKKWSQEKGGAIVIVDETAAELIAELKNAGLHVEGHKGKVLDGIAIVQGLLVPQGDGKPRYTCDPSCVNTINEWESYVWRPGKDEPVKENDHEMDLIRYVAHWLFAKEFTVEEVIYAPIRIGYG